MTKMTKIITNDEDNNDNNKYKYSTQEIILNFINHLHTINIEKEENTTVKNQIEKYKILIENKITEKLTELFKHVNIL